MGLQYVLHSEQHFELIKQESCGFWSVTCDLPCQVNKYKYKYK